MGQRTKSKTEGGGGGVWGGTHDVNRKHLGCMVRTGATQRPWALHARHGRGRLRPSSCWGSAAGNGSTATNTPTGEVQGEGRRHTHNNTVNTREIRAQHIENPLATGSIPTNTNPETTGSLPEGASDRRGTQHLRPWHGHRLIQPDACTARGDAPWPSPAGRRCWFVGKFKVVHAFAVGAGVTGQRQGQHRVHAAVAVEIKRVRTRHGYLAIPVRAFCQSENF